MNIRTIKSEADYKLALKRLEEVFDARIGTAESDEADIPGVLIDELKKNTTQLKLRIQLKRSKQDKH